MHNAALKRLHLNAAYVALLVRAGELHRVLARVWRNELAGLNVTIPHKQVVMRHLDKLTPVAKQIGAVNVVERRGQRLIGHNTDGAGYLMSLKKLAGFRPRGKNVVMVGAGGAALAIAHALGTVGIQSLTIFNRDAAKARRLIVRLRQTYPAINFHAGPWPATEGLPNQPHLFINATAMGMNGQPWPDLGFLATLPRSTLVSDIVYNPVNTELLRTARRHQLKTHPGYGMLLFQGALAFEIFTGRKAPVGVMRRALLRSLKKGG